MTKIIELQTQRLRLRQWQAQDRDRFAAINADSQVMEYYPKVLDREQSDSMADKLETLISDRGWGFWAVEVISVNKFIGFVGLHEPTYDLPITPCVEIGWRLSRHHWGKGYATEAARASLVFAFADLDLDAVYSFTSVSNHKSRRVMERIGMLNTGTNFDHPMVPEDSPLLEHVLYKVNNSNR